MSCVRTRHLVDALIDGELDAVTQEQLREHLAGCAECETLQGERLRVRERVRSAAAPEGAPPAFAAALRERLLRETPMVDRRRPAPAWRQATWLFAAGAAVATVATFLVLRWPAADDTPELVAAAHTVAAMRAGGDSARLVQVAASDRHVVKPWFQGKLDFTPPVVDLAEQGFTLIGARIDRVARHEAAVVVYRVRNHPIELFVWHERAAAAMPATSRVARGFPVVEWVSGDLRFVAISDADAAELERFAGALRSAR